MTFTIQIGGPSPFPLITNFLAYATASAKQSQADTIKQKVVANG